MLNMVKGFKVFSPEKLNEGYEITSEMSIMANVNAEKILDIFFVFVISLFLSLYMYRML